MHKYNYVRSPQRKTWPLFKSFMWLGCHPGSPSDGPQWFSTALHGSKHNTVSFSGINSPLYLSEFKVDRIYESHSSWSISDISPIQLAPCCMNKNHVFLYPTLHSAQYPLIFFLPALSLQATMGSASTPLHELAVGTYYFTITRVSGCPRYVKSILRLLTQYCAVCHSYVTIACFYITWRIDMWTVASTTLLFWDTLLTLDQQVGGYCFTTHANHLMLNR